MADLTAMVKEYGSSPAATRPYGSPTPKMQRDVLDGDGNLRAADIGITWADNETFLHGVRVVGTKFSRPTGQEPVMSTPYSEGRNDDRGPSPMTGRPSSPETLEFGPETIPIARPAGDHPHRPAMEARQGYRPAAPIQRFNNKSLNWPAWFRHFRAVADVHGWSKEQRALQLVSYLDETAMNVAQELGDSDLYNYDVLIKLLGDRFDPASRVSASRSRFHARSRRHNEDADAFADALAELCRVGYPQSPPELRQELIAEQFVRGQSDPELKKYLWVVIRTQKNRKLQTLIEVCTDFSSLVSPTHLHRPAAESLAICRVVARDRTPPYLLNQQDGTSNLTTGLHATATAVRETLSRSGHHPHRSIRTSSGPFVIFIHHIDLVNSVTGYRYHTYSSTIEYMYRNMRVLHGSAGWGTTGGAFTRHRGTPVIC